jgi:predicted unusual protein kinase regulating ubiquinone biosynthesis (AarF/ABC1/UbiB family)
MTPESLAELGVEHMNGKQLLTKLLVGRFKELPAGRRGGLIDEASKLIREGADKMRIVSVVLGHLGPGFVKLAQLLSGRPDLIADARWRAALGELNYAGPTVPFAAVRERLPRRLQEALEHLDERPFAAGSVAQIHAGRLSSGDRVVVKILKPGVREELGQNFAYLENFVRQHAPKAALLHRLLGELRRSSSVETHFSKEGPATEYAGHRVIDRVPTVYAHLSNNDVLVLQKLELTTLPARARGLAQEERAQLARRAFSAVLDQVVEAGYFHADPTKGNALLERTSGDLTFIDWGLHGQQLSIQERSAVKDLACGLLEGNGMVALRGFSKLADDVEVDEIRDILRSGGTVIDKLNRVVDSGLGLSGNLLLAIKAIVQADGLAREIDRSFSATEVMRRQLSSGWASPRNGVPLPEGRAIMLSGGGAQQAVVHGKVSGKGVRIEGCYADRIGYADSKKPLRNADLREIQNGVFACQWDDRTDVMVVDKDSGLVLRYYDLPSLGPIYDLSGVGARAHEVQLGRVYVTEQDGARVTFRIERDEKGKLTLLFLDDEAVLRDPWTIDFEKVTDGVYENERGAIVLNEATGKVELLNLCFDPNRVEEWQPQIYDRVMLLDDNPRMRLANVKESRAPIDDLPLEPGQLFWAQVGAARRYIVAVDKVTSREVSLYIVKSTKSGRPSALESVGLYRLFRRANGDFVVRYGDTALRFDTRARRAFMVLDGARHALRPIPRAFDGISIDI